MTKTEKIWLFVGFLALGALILLEVSRVHKSVMAAQAQFGTPQSTNANPPGQQYGPGDGTDAIAAGVGPWYLYYNTPGVYMTMPPLVNTTMAPNMVQPANSNSSSCDGNCA